MKEHGKITERQFAGILANTLMGAGTLILPRTITSIAGTGAWISVIFGGIVSIVLLLLFIRLGLRFPEETIMEYGVRITNKWIGGIIGFTFCTYWLFAAGLIIRIFSSLLVSAVLIETPIEVVMIAMLLTVAYFIRSDLEVIGRINEIYFIFVIVPIIYALFLGIKEINLLRILPLTGGQGLKPILTAGIASFFSFFGFEIVTLLIPSLTTQKLAYNYGLKGIITPLLSYVALVIVSVGFFGVEELQTLTWPTLELIKATPFPGLLLERLEAVFIAFWVVAIFTSSANLFYVSIVGLSQIFKIKEHKTLIFPLLPLAYYLAILPEDIFAVFSYMENISIIGAIIIIFTVIFYSVISLIRKIKGDERS